MSRSQETAPQVSAKKIGGKVLQRLRSGRGFVQEDMADRLGKARSSLAGWEAGRGGLNLENLLAFLDELGVTMEEFGKRFDALRWEALGPEHQPARARGSSTLSPVRIASQRTTPIDGAEEVGNGDPGSPIILRANQAFVLLFGEQGAQETLPREEDLQPWVRDLFKRAERLFPAAEEMPEPLHAEEGAGESEPAPERTAAGSNP